MLTGLLYAPVRFFLDFLRPEDSDPRHAGLTFAQWASILAFGVAIYVLGKIMKNGEPAKVVAPTSKEAQQKLKLILKEAEDEVDDEDDEAEAAAEKPAKKAKSKDDKKKDKEPEPEPVEDEQGISLVEGAANVPFMVPRDVVSAAKAALDGDEHVRAAYYMPIRVKGEQRMVIGLDLDDTAEAHWKELAGKLAKWPVLVLDNKQLIDAARGFDRKIYPAESDGGAAAAKMEKPNARAFKDGADKVVRPKREEPLKLVMPGIAVTAPPEDQPKASKDEPKAAEVKADEPKAAEAKADEPKAAEVKADEPKAAEVKADEVKADEPKAAEAKADEPKKDTSA